MAGGLNRSITVRLLADTASYEAKMAKAGASAEQLAGGLEKTGSKTGMITNGLALAGAAATAFGVMAVKTFADFDASMSTVQANTGATASQMDALRQAAIDAGADTVYSASEAADGINELGKAGLSTTDILSGGLSGALNLAASDGMAVGEAAELMATTLKEFNLTGADSSKVADALAAGAGKAVGSAHDLGLALNQAGMVSHSFGISMQETTGTLAAFANSGMIGSDAGTSLKTMLIALANPSTKAANLMEELGINAYDASGNFVGLAGLAGQLQTALGGLSQEQRNQALATIFGSDAIRAANVLYEQGTDGINDWTKAVSESGYAAEQAAAKNDNLKGDLENLSGSIESLMISIGSGANGPLRSLVQTLDMLVDGFSQLPAPVQQTIVLATALAGGFAAVHKAATPLTTSSSALAQAMGLLVDPWQRMTTAAPQLKEGFLQLGTAMITSNSSMNVLSTGLTRGQIAMSGLKSVGSGVVSLLGGPWGIAITVAGAALMSFAQNAQAAKQRTEEVKTALESTGDASEALVNQVQSMQIGDDLGVLGGLRRWSMDMKTLPDLLDKVGLSISDMVKAAEGSGEALDKVNSVIEKVGGAKTSLEGEELQRALDKLTESYNKGKEAAGEKTEALDQLSGASENATGATNTLTSSMQDDSDAAEDASKAIDSLVQSMFSVESPALNADEAVTKLNQTLLESTQTIQANGVVLDQAGNALAGHEEAAYKSQAALQSMASSAQSAAQKIMEEAEANFQADHSTEELKSSTDEANATLGTAREKFIEAAVAAGMSEDAAKKLADQYGLIPGSVSTDIIIKGYESTISKIGTIKNEFATLPDGKTIHVNMEYTETGQHNVLGSTGGTIPKSALATGGLVGYADGGRIPGFASGGFDGYIKGLGTATSDSNLIRVSKGEFVEQASAVDYYGAEFFHALNKQRIPRELLYKTPNVTIQQPQPTKEDRRMYITLNVTGTPDPEVTARKTFAYLKANIPGGGL